MAIRGTKWVSKRGATLAQLVRCRSTDHRTVAAGSSSQDAALRSHGKLPSQDHHHQQQQQRNEKYDLVGHPDPVSNIRPLRLRVPASRAEREIQKLRLQVWALNHHFWAEHNTDFEQRKSAFVKEILQKKRALGELTEDDDTSKVTADELSVFYKEFLDSKFKDQLNFTRNWMKLNSLLTWNQFKYRLLTLIGYNR